MVRQGRIAAAIVGLALLAAAALPASAGAVIIVGSDLTGVPGNAGGASDCSPIPAPCTDLLDGVHHGNPYPALSPTDGTVTGFNILLATGTTVTYRIGRFQQPQTTADRATGVATGPTASYASGGTFNTPASLPIHAGDAIGIDSSSQ